MAAAATAVVNKPAAIYREKTAASQQCVQAVWATRLLSQQMPVSMAAIPGDGWQRCKS